MFLLEGMDNMVILLVMLGREVCWGRRVFGVFKLNYIRIKFINYINEFGFYF